MSMISMMAMEIWYGPADKILDRERRKEGIMYTREQKEKALAIMIQRNQSQRSFVGWDIRRYRRCMDSKSR